MTGKRSLLRQSTEKLRVFSDERIQRGAEVLLRNILRSLLQILDEFLYGSGLFFGQI